MPVCPVHQSGRDLTTAQVWVATPASLVFTTMPTDLVKTRMPALEAIYHWRHLVIVDEVDRVQLSVDSVFQLGRLTRDNQESPDKIDE
jgi:hypothetical protein